MAAAIDAEADHVAVALSDVGYLDGRALAEVLRGWPHRPGVRSGSTTMCRAARRRRSMCCLEHRHHPHARRAAPRKVQMGVRNTLTEPAGSPCRRSGGPRGNHDRHVRRRRCRRPQFAWQACLSQRAAAGERGAAVGPVSSGHIAALVDPPGSPKASYRVSSTDERNPDQWATAAGVHPDSWWPDFSAWLVERGGDQKTAPKKLGIRGLPPLGPAPGTYVHDR